MTMMSSYDMEEKDNQEQDMSEKEDSSEDPDSDSSSDFDSSEWDDEYEQKYNGTVELMTHLEDQYNHVRKLCINYRNFKLDQQLKQICEETAEEYLQPLEELKENRNLRIRNAQHIKEFRTKNLNIFLEAECLANKQNYVNGKEILKESIKKEIIDHIQKLNEDRLKIDTEISSDSNYTRKCKKYPYNDDYQEKRKKPTVVQGPVIIYSLKEEDVMEDLKLIKACMTAKKNNFLIS